MEEVDPEGKYGRGACEACGFSPVPHLSTYVSQSLDAWVNDRIESRNGLRFLAALEQKVAEPSAFFLVRAMLACGIARGSARIEFASTYRDQVVWEEALHRTIPMQQILVLGKPTDVYRAKIRSSWFYFRGLPVPPASKERTHPSLDDKYVFKRFLQRERIPAAPARLVRHAGELPDAFEELRKPLVVKPRLGSRSRHTTSRVNTIEDLRAAFWIAKKLCRDVIVEEQLEGPVSRATVVEGKLEGFFIAGQPYVAGNGADTIQELVRQKNDRRPERIQPIVLSNEHITHLARQGYSLESVLPQGAQVELTRNTGRFAGGETHERAGEIHPKLRAYVEQAATALKVPVVGFDIIIPDPTADPDLQRWGVLEANSVPFIDVHYLPLRGEPSNVAAAVWNLWGAAATP